MADESSAHPWGFLLLKVSSDHHLSFFFFSILLRELQFPLWPSPSWQWWNCCLAWSFSLEWWPWLENTSLLLLLSEHIWVNWLWSHCSWREGRGLTMDGTFIDQNIEGDGGETEQPRRADYGNASTYRLKGCAFEAQERSNKSSILLSLSLKCLGYLSMNETERLAQNVKQQLWTNTSQVHTLHKNKGKIGGKIGFYFLWRFTYYHLHWAFKHLHLNMI